MITIPVNLGTEDELSERVLLQITRRVRRGYYVGTAYRRGGFGYLRRTVAGWNRAAQGRPFIVLADLDNHTCPRALIDEWLPQPQHPNLLFRVAVREVEAWLLADSKNLSLFLGVREDAIPVDPESLQDPKRALIELARSSRSSSVRDRIVPKRGSTAKQGPDYNGCLGGFVTTHWDFRVATKRSPSLARAVKTLTKFKPLWPNA
jgi:hypothetical protein